MKTQLSLNELLQQSKSSTQTCASGPNCLDMNHANQQQTNKQTSPLMSQIYVAEHEKYLRDLKQRQAPAMQIQPVSSPTFDILMHRLKVLSTSKKTIKQYEDSSSSSSMEERECANCVRMQEKEQSQLQQKFARTLEEIAGFKSLITQSDTLSKMFNSKFGSLDKIERLFNEGKHLKLINKLIKVVGLIFKKLMAIKMDDVLLTNRSEQCNRYDTAEPKGDKFTTPPQPQTHDNNAYLKQSPRFNQESPNHQYYFAKKLPQPPKVTVSQFPILNRKYVSQEINPMRTNTTQQDEMTSSGYQSVLIPDTKPLAPKSKSKVQAMKKVQLMPHLKAKKSRSSTSRSPKMSLDPRLKASHSSQFDLS